MQNKLEKLIWVMLGSTWLSHLIGVFTPETGFDAVWYHLPVAKAIWSQKSLVYLPELYQSTNPLLSDLVFTLGYGLGGEFGTKLIAYLFSLSLAIVTFLLANRFLSRFWSLWVTLVASTFQVLAWQASSFYVDVAKAMWEVLSLWLLVRWSQHQRPSNLVLAGLVFGFSLGTKLFSLLLLPLMLWLVWSWSQGKQLRNLALFFTASLIPALPFYFFAWTQTGNPFYSLSVHLQKIGEIGAGGSSLAHLINRTLDLPLIWESLVFGRDYTSFLLILFLPILVISLKWLWREKATQGLLLFSLGQMVIWWYLPPLSTRYALSGFVVWLMLSLVAISHLVSRKHKYYWSVIVSMLLGVMINLAPRIHANLRSWRYLSGQQTKTEYLHQFHDGNIDQHLNSWHRL